MSLDSKQKKTMGKLLTFKDVTEHNAITLEKVNNSAFESHSSGGE